MNRKVLLAKGGLDGHDRGIQVVARALRDAGCEIVYLGLYCPPEEIVAAAVQEDPDLIGISMLSGAHLSVFPEVLKLLKEKTGEDWFVFGGGVIPQKDILLLEKAGVKKIFLPSTDTREIVDFVLGAKVAQNTKKSSLLDLSARINAGEISAASKLMTRAVRGGKEAKVWIAEWLLPETETLLIGVTGPGGAGKSTLINKLIHSFRQEGKTCGAVLHDPVSISGGAFLGDRIRMREHALDSEVFIRSLAQRKNFKGVTWVTPYIVKILKAMRKEVIILETVGVGQGDLGFSDLVETTIWVDVPGLGDEVQTLKGGAIETADIIVVNKADKDEPAAEKKFQDLLSVFGSAKKICKTDSLTGSGIPELVKAIKEHKKFILNKAAQ